MASKSSSSSKRRRAPARGRTRQASRSTSGSPKKSAARKTRRTGSRGTRTAAAGPGEPMVISPALRRELKQLGVRWQSILPELRRARGTATPA